MSAIFVDTSALYALLDADDAGHTAAKMAWIQLLNSDSPLITSNYILLETFALLQHRIGIDAVRAFHEGIAPLLEVLWIDKTTHDAAASMLLIAGKRKLSLVDCTSFEVMRHAGARTAFSLDRDFQEHGFTTVPTPG